MFTVHMRTKICSYSINLMFIIKKFNNLMYNPSFIGFLQHVPDQSMLLLYPALSRSSSVSRRSVVLHLQTGNVHKISIFKPSEFRM